MTIKHSRQGALCERNTMLFFQNNCYVLFVDQLELCIYFFLFLDKSIVGNANNIARARFLRQLRVN